MLTQSEYIIIKKYKPLIERIIQSRAASLIPTELIEIMKEVLGRNKIDICFKCPSGMLRAFSIIKGELDSYEKIQSRKIKKSNKGKY